MALSRTVEKAVARALKAFDDLAGDLTIVSLDETSYDPGTGETLEPPQEYVFKGILDDYSRDDIDGSLVQATDKIGYIWPRDDDLAPMMGWKLVDPNDEDIKYTVLSVQKIRPRTTLFLYELQLRT